MSWREEQGGSLQPHANILVRNIPQGLDVGTFQAMFRSYGLIEGCRFFPTAKVPYGFIKLDTVEASHNAVRALNGTVVRGSTLMVRSADTDCEYEKPNNNLYCVNVPMSWDEDAVRQIFQPFGNVQSVRMLPPVQGLPGKGAMIRMGSPEEAREARNELNARAPLGEPMPLVVKFADSPEDKQRKMAARQQPTDGAPISGGPGAGGGGAPAQRYTPYGAPPAAGGYQAPVRPSYGQEPAYERPQEPVIPHNICVSNLPLSADRLTLYEHFAPYGPVLQVAQPVQGVSWITYENASSAHKASRARHSSKIHETIISVSMPQPAAAPSPAPAPMPTPAYSQPPSGYAPPPQAGYAPPGPGGYAPPAQGGYAPPPQGGYAPPQPAPQGGYAPAPGPQGGQPMYGY